MRDGSSLIGAAGLVVERRTIEPDGPTSLPDRHPLPGSACLHARERPNRCTSREPVRAADQGSELSPDHVLQHLSIERQVRHDLPQPRVPVLELLKTLHLGRQKTGIHFLPVETGRRADPRFAADSATGVPTSPCLMMSAFCTSEKLLAFIRFRSSPSQESVTENSSFKRSSFRGSDQLLYAGQFRVF